MVFTVFLEARLDMYFCRMDIPTMETLTNPIALDEVDSIGELLNTKMDKKKPDITIDRASAEFWLSKPTSFNQLSK